MTTDREAIVIILRNNNIDPDLKIGERTAFDVLEAAIMAGLDTIEEETDENR